MAFPSSFVDKNSIMFAKFRKEALESDCPVIKRMIEITADSHLNACLLAASLRPETKIGVKELATMLGGYEEIASRWYEILHWIKDQLMMGAFFDRDLRDLLVGLAAAIKAKGLKVG